MDCIVTNEVRRTAQRCVLSCLVLVSVMGLPACQSLLSSKQGFDVVVTESKVYTTRQASNGAGPLWDFSSTNIVRVGETVWVSGLNTVEGLPPLNNTECNLWKETNVTWKLVQTLPGLTREPCPMGVLRGERLVISTNATMNPPGKAGGGSARPAIWEETPSLPDDAPVVSEPQWRHDAKPEGFSEHSYRSFAVDGKRGEIFLMQNVGNSHAEWAFRDGESAWISQGRLDWPIKQINGRTIPLRICYTVTIIVNRAVHLLGVSDFVEPNDDWREFKYKLTGRKWDYVFRNLYYTWTPDISKESFKPWIEIASRESTGGQIWPGDLWLDQSGAAHVVWEETTLDSRLRDRFFPGAQQSRGIYYGVIRNGEIILQTALLTTRENKADPEAQFPRFHITPDGKMYVFFFVDGVNSAGAVFSENRIAEIVNGKLYSMIHVPLTKPLNRYMTASTRAGNLPSNSLDLLGTEPGNGDAVRYVKIRIR